VQGLTALHIPSAPRGSPLRGLRDSARRHVLLIRRPTRLYFPRRHPLSFPGTQSVLKFGAREGSLRESPMCTNKKSRGPSEIRFRFAPGGRWDKTKLHCTCGRENNSAPEHRYQLFYLLCDRGRRSVRAGVKNAWTAGLLWSNSAKAKISRSTWPRMGRGICYFYPSVAFTRVR